VGFDLREGARLRLTDGSVVTFVEPGHRPGHHRVRNAFGEIEPIRDSLIDVILSKEPLGFWEQVAVSLAETSPAANTKAFLAAGKVSSRTHRLGSWGTIRAIPYLFQYTPYFALRRSPWGRILVADETGLGKTVEAGIVIKELFEEENPNERVEDVLVVGPISLFSEWELKLQDHFGIEIKLISADDLINRFQSFRIPRKMKSVHFISMDSLKTLLKVEGMSTKSIPHTHLYDLVVVDEAHNFKNAGRKRQVALELLLGDPFQDSEDDQDDLKPIPKLILMTATPLSTDLDNLTSYFSLMDPGLKHMGGLEVRQRAFREEHRHVMRARRLANLVMRVLENPHCTETVLKLKGLLLEEQRRLGLIKHEDQAEFGSKFDELDQLMDELLADLDVQADELPATPTGSQELLKDNWDQEWIGAIEELGRFSENPQAFDEVAIAELLLKIDPWCDMLVRNTRKGVGMKGETQVTVVNHSINLVGPEQRLVDAAPWTLSEHAFGQLAIKQQLASSIPGYLYREVMKAGLEEPRDSERLEEFGDPTPTKTRERIRQLASERFGYPIVRTLADLSLVPDSKFKELEAALHDFFDRSGQRAAIIFTRYNPSAFYLKTRLDLLAEIFDLEEVIYLHGGVPPALRKLALQRAKAQTGRILLVLTEVGQEGIDLQFCTGVFHYDLPWNPMRLIQRNGRIHRIGQTAKEIFIHTFHVTGSLDERISGAIARRMELVYRTFGDLPEGLIGSNPSRDLNRLLGDGVAWEVFNNLRGIKNLATFEADADLEAFRFEQQTTQISLHEEAIRHLVEEEADACRGWFPLIQESLSGAKGSIDRVQATDIEALLDWASHDAATGLRIEPSTTGDAHRWTIHFGQYQLPDEGGILTRDERRLLNQQGWMEAEVLPDTGGRRSDLAPFQVLHLKHSLIQDLSGRLRAAYPQPFMLVSSCNIEHPLALLCVEFTIGEGNAAHGEARWVLFERHNGMWEPLPERGSAERLANAWEDLQSWEPTTASEDAVLGAELRQSLYLIQERIQEDLELRNQRVMARRAYRSIRQWRPLLAYRQEQLDTAQARLADFEWKLEHQRDWLEAQLSDRASLPPDRQLNRQHSTLRGQVTFRMNRLNSVTQRLDALTRELQRIETEPPSPVRVRLADLDPHALILIYPKDRT